jgi:prophage tail gpP-like protein
VSSQPQAPGQPASPRRGDDVEILIREGHPWYEGEIFSDWKSLEIHRSLFTAAGSFKIDAAHQRPWPLRPEVDVQIKLAGHAVMDGVVDSLKSAVEGDNKSLQFAGRDNTAALVDCSAQNEPGEWRDVTVRQIIKDIAKPFFVKISALGRLGDEESDKIPVFKLQPGERAWTAIERATRLKGYTAFAYGDGSLRLSRIGDDWAHVELIEGEQGNILSSNITWSHVDRFSTYVVRGQSAGGDEGWGSSVLEAEGRARDGSVSRDRPLLLIASGQINPADAQAQAQWEASIRAAKSAKLKVQVAGWRKTPHPTSDIWRLNQKIHCTIPSQGLDQQMLIDDIRFRRSLQGGTTTELNLVRPDAYNPKPEVDPVEEPFADFLGELETDG